MHNQRKGVFAKVDVLEDRLRTSVSRIFLWRTFTPLIFRLSVQDWHNGSAALANGEVFYFVFFLPPALTSRRRP
jgi:hypothetical protein